MLLSDCAAEVGSDGRLLLRDAGVWRMQGEIGSWSTGFEPSVVRNGCRVVSYFWSLDLLSAAALRHAPAPVARFVEGIPPDIRAAVGRYQFAQCIMLRYAAISSAARDLLHGHPNLLWLVACGAYDGRIDPAEIAQLCCRKQVDILRRLARPATPAALRLLRKVETECGTLSESREIMRAVGRSEIVAATAHQKRVPATLLNMLLRHPRLADRHVVAILSSALDRGHRSPYSLARRVADNIADIARMARAIGVARVDEAIARCREVSELDALHDRWVNRINRELRDPGRCLERLTRHAAVPGNGAAGQPLAGQPLAMPPTAAPRGMSHPGRFPPPPLADSEDIEAITNWADLALEGQTQQHCVASYAQAIAQGDTYIYRVLRPARATLELRRVDDRWEIGQLKRARNQEPGIMLRKRVWAWFADASRAPQPSQNEK